MPQARRRQVVIAALTGVAIIAAALSTVLALRPDRPAAVPGRHGTLEQWIAATCPSGRATAEHAVLAGSTVSGLCLAATPPQGTGDQARDTAVGYGVFATETDIHKDLPKLSIAYYATADPSPDGTVPVFFVLTDRYGDEPLKPLERFGFHINRGPVK
ncbi:hypothetical protein [Mycobacteroides abscessus]|uniref:hypothetical protein n=1 Tax=Mycobacteroides abscessus TaxID=36809 RepID=UPI0012FFE0F7|nr:hypothetical protein [Mycobacteroides abscessus]